MLEQQRLELAHVGAGELAYALVASEERKRRHGSHLARGGHLLVVVHIHGGKVHVEHRCGERGKGGRGRLARSAPRGGEVDHEEAPRGLGAGERGAKCRGIRKLRHRPLGRRWRWRRHSWTPAARGLRRGQRHLLGCPGQLAVLK